MLASLLLWLPFASASRASEPPLDDIVVTGTRLEGPAADSPMALTVLDRAELRQLNYDHLADLLRTVAGVHVSQPGGRGGPNAVFIRGGDPNFTLVLIDGIRVNDLNSSRGGTFDLASIDIDSIERIEIVKGARSAVYGSDALSGVINIITRAPGSAYTAVAGIDVGSRDYLAGRVDLSAPLGDRGGLSFGAGALDIGHPVAGSTFESSEAAGRLRYQAADAWHLDVIARYAETDSTTFADDSGGPLFAENRALRAEQANDLAVRGQLRWLASDRVVVNVAADSYRHEAEQATPRIAAGVRPAVPASADDTKLLRDSLALYISSGLGQRGQLLLGADAVRERGESAGFIDIAPGFRLPAAYDIDRTVKSVFSEYRHRTDVGVTLVAGLRADMPGGRATQTNGNVGLNYRFHDGLSRVFLNWGEGFKLPSFYALANPVVGNSGLRPEESTGVDLGVQRYFRGKTADVTVTLFRQEFSDLIDFDPVQFRLVNRDKVETEGVELEFGLRPADAMSLVGHATYTMYDVPGSDAVLRHRPRWRGGLSWRWTPTDAVAASVSWLYTDEVADSSVPTGAVTLPAQQRLDATVIWQSTPRLEYRLSVDNLLDSDHEEAVGFPVPGTRLRLSLRYRFGAAAPGH